MADHHEADCPVCTECPSCEDGANTEPLVPALDTTSYPGVVVLRCGLCGGVGLLCGCSCHTPPVT